MEKRTFKNTKKFLHLPIRDDNPSVGKYIKVYDGNDLVHEFYINVAIDGKAPDFYVALNLANYKNDEVTFVCEYEDAKGIFDGFVYGETPEKEKGLYPNLYREPSRQQIHFSSRCGWMNDLNGLFYKDGKFNVYFQHNPFGSRNGFINVSWGHAITEDLVHFTEYPDAIMPISSRCFIASGSSFVDNKNFFKKGKGAIISACTYLQSHQYNGRPKVTQDEGQNLYYSTDEGMTFNRFDFNPIIPVPDGYDWRDPKIFEYNGKMYILVFEPVSEEPSTSFYESEDGIKWNKISSGEKFHECPDFFELEVEGKKDEKLYVMYGGNGKYSIGTFENLKFTAIEQDLYLDYGGWNSIYAGQTFCNYPSTKKRIYVAWLIDNNMRCTYLEGQGYGIEGFNSSMSLPCELSLVKTKLGYRVFKKPIDNLLSLRKDGKEYEFKNSQFLKTPCEYVFTLNNQDVTFTVNGEKFSFRAKERKIISDCRNYKEYDIISEGELTVRMFADVKSVEFFIADEVSLTYYIDTRVTEVMVDALEPIKATVYDLKSIWEEK